MSEDKTPDWIRHAQEIQSHVRGLWDELAKLSDWIWHVEQQADRIEHRVAELESKTSNLRRDLNSSTARPIRPRSWRNIGWLKPSSFDSPASSTEEDPTTSEHNLQEHLVPLDDQPE